MPPARVSTCWRAISSCGTAYESLERLRQVWALARPLGALHQAISYAHIVAGLEATAKHEVAWGISYWLQKVLQFLEPESPATGL
jgi:hypothetical protein